MLLRRCLGARRLLRSGVSGLSSVSQPTHGSHPHLLRSGEVTPGLSRNEFAARRAAVASRMKQGSISPAPRLLAHAGKQHRRYRGFLKPRDRHLHHGGGV